MANASVGIIPPEAKSAGGLNASTPPEQRDPKGSQPKASGPQKDSLTGAYAPAEYETTRDIANARGDVVTHKHIRRDR